MYPFERVYPVLFKGEDIFAEGLQHKRILQFLDAHPEVKEKILDIHREFVSLGGRKSQFTVVTLFFRSGNTYHAYTDYEDVGDFTKRDFFINTNTLVGYNNHWDINYNNIFIEIE